MNLEDDVSLFVNEQEVTFSTLHCKDDKRLLFFKLKTSLLLNLRISFLKICHHKHKLNGSK